jgi:hypothetical protein
MAFRCNVLVRSGQFVTGLFAIFIYAFPGSFLLQLLCSDIQTSLSQTSGISKLLSNKNNLNVFKHHSCSHQRMIIAKREHITERYTGFSDQIIKSKSAKSSTNS